MILSNDLDLGKKFNSSVFPGLQGPLMHVIAAKAVAFWKLFNQSLNIHQQVKKNASILEKFLCQME